MPTTSNDGVTIAWQQSGRPTAPPLLLITGHVFGSDMWHRLVGPLSDSHRVITYENWGVGGSGCPQAPHTIGRMARDAETVLDAAGVPSAYVLGLGMGGLVAQELALSTPHRVDALVLASTGCPGATAEPGTPPAPLHQLPVSRFFSTERGVIYGPLTPDSVIEEDRAALCSTRVSPAGLRAQARAVACYESFERVPRITAPTLVVHGDLDRVVPLEKGVELSERIPDAELLVIPASGHNLSSPYAGLVARAITEFLDRQGLSDYLPRQAS